MVTLVWFLPSMSPHIYFNEMFFRHYASSYGLLNYLSLQNSCHIALIWILPRMFFEMTCKIIIPWRGLVTLTEVICFYLEFILLLSRMLFQMTWKITIPWKKGWFNWLHWYVVFLFIIFFKYFENYNLLKVP